MWERAVFLDRDNTIIENDGYLGDPSKVKLLPGAGTALAALRALGYRLIVVSNQSGVARGMFDEAAVEAVNQEMSRQLLEQAGSYVDASYYCPYHPDAPIAEYRADHDWRKPKPGMLKQAAADFGVDLAQSWMIGDQGRDVGAGAAAGCRTILLRDPNVTPATDTDMSAPVSPSFVVRTLADAARIVAREGRNPPPPAPQPAAAPPAPVQEKRPAPAAPPSPLPPASAAPLSESPILRTPSPATATLTETSEKAPKPAKLAQDIPTAIAPSAASAKLEHSLEELIVLLRNQARNADLHPDFSYSNMGALILQIFAIASLAIGLYRFFAAPTSFVLNDWTAFYHAQLAQTSAIIWATVALVFQGMVIALLVRARNKERH